MASGVEGSSSDEEIIEQVFIYRTKNQYPDGANESKKRAIWCDMFEGIHTSY